jgi:long-chain acyl-CoA synthetase
MSVSELLRNTARLFPDKTAIYFNDFLITYRSLDQGVDNLARGLLNLGLKRQEMVGLLMGNCSDFVYSYFAIISAGSSGSSSTPCSCKYLLNQAEVVFLISMQSFLPMVKRIWHDVPTLQRVLVTGGETGERIVSYRDLLNMPAEPIEIAVKPNDIAACLFTSGTTGKPKGALLSHSNLVFDVQASTERIQMDSQDQHLCVLPLFHSFALMATLLCPLYTGGSIVVLPQFHPNLVLQEITSKKVTVFYGIPTMFASILPVLEKPNDYDLKSLRLCIAGGAPTPVELMQIFEDRYKVVILEGDGPTETSPVAYVNPPELRKLGSVGPPLNGVWVKIVDDADRELTAGEIGEICIKGPNVMQGYLKRPEATAEAIKDGWFYTGDMGKVDEDGYVYILDRKKDMIIVGGLNVYPREIEDCLLRHPRVAEAAVIGIPEELRGEVPLALVVLKAGATTAEELILYCRRMLANFKCPRQVFFVDSLPKTATGKVDKKQLRKQYNVINQGS